MAREKGATTTDKAAHRVYDTTLPNRQKFPILCPRCGMELSVAYHEERLYSVQCGKCRTVTLVKSGNPYTAAMRVGIVARTAEEYHEDRGPVLWWHFPIEEPPEVGTPDTYDRYGASVISEYHTHWTPIPIPSKPAWEG